MSETNTNDILSEKETVQKTGAQEREDKYKGKEDAEKKQVEIIKIRMPDGSEHVFRVTEAGVIDTNGNHVARDVEQLKAQIKDKIDDEKKHTTSFEITERDIREEHMDTVIGGTMAEQIDNHIQEKLDEIQEKKEDEEPVKPKEKNDVFDELAKNPEQSFVAAFFAANEEKPKEADAKKAVPFDEWDSTAVPLGAAASAVASAGDGKSERVLGALRAAGMGTSKPPKEENEAGSNLINANLAIQDVKKLENGQIKPIEAENKLKGETTKTETEKVDIEKADTNKDAALRQTANTTLKNEALRRAGLKPTTASVGSNETEITGKEPRVRQAMKGLTPPPKKLKRNANISNEANNKIKKILVAKEEKRKNQGRNS